MRFEASASLVVVGFVIVASRGTTTTEASRATTRASHVLTPAFCSSGLESHSGSGSASSRTSYRYGGTGGSCTATAGGDIIAGRVRGRRRKSGLHRASNNDDETAGGGDTVPLVEMKRKAAATYVDAVVEVEGTNGVGDAVEGKIAFPGASKGGGDGGENIARRRKRDIFQHALRDLASLSLVDYKWRSELFKKNEADRMEEEIVARMMGEDASYARPMDADDSRRGPLGNAERSAVRWLKQVIEEEGNRAKRIAESDGRLIRPKDLGPGDDAGPLSDLERRAVAFLSDVTDSEVRRVREGTIRPMNLNSDNASLSKNKKIWSSSLLNDVDPDDDDPGGPGSRASRNPLGEAEARAVLALSRIVESEKYRADQSKQRGGVVVRPIDVPGPLGEFERAVGDIVRSEQQRVLDRKVNEGKMVRPKDASISSPLGNAERKAVNDWELVRKEENERLSSLRRFLNERRPKERDPNSPLGVTEAFAATFTSAVLRGPQLAAKVCDRVKELVRSEKLDGEDRNVLQQSLPSSEDNQIADSEEFLEDRSFGGAAPDEGGKS